MVPGHEPVRIDGARHVSEDLGEAECWERLRAQDTGRIGFVHHGRVMILPVNYLVHDHAIYFRTSLEGLIGGPAARTQTSFQIDDARADRSEGWSVLANGSSSHVVDRELLTRLWGHMTAEPWAGGDRGHFICIQPAIITGKHVFLA